jgi:hypothetical protein
MKALVVVLAMLVVTPRADACDDFAPIVKPLGYTLGLAMAGGYVAGVGYFGWHDLANDRADNDYLGGDIAFNGLFTAIWGTATVEAARDHSGWALPLAGLTAMHGAMLVHGLDHVSWDFHNFDGTAATWTLGSLWGLQALVFASADGDRQDRGYGVAELAVNAPLAAGSAYLAFQSMHDNRGDRAMLMTGVAAVSTALAIHGGYTALHPYHSAGLDFLPTATSDSVGLSAARTF